METNKQPGNTPAVQITEAEFVEQYDGVAVTTMGPFVANLGEALELESMFCPVNDTPEAADPVKRLSYLAKIVGLDQLLPEHQSLLSDD